MGNERSIAESLKVIAHTAAKTVPGALGKVKAPMDGYEDRLSDEDTVHIECGGSPAIRLHTDNLQKDGRDSQCGIDLAADKMTVHILYTPFAEAASSGSELSPQAIDAIYEIPYGDIERSADEIAGKISSEDASYDAAHGKGSKFWDAGDFESECRAVLNGWADYAANADIEGFVDRAAANSGVIKNDAYARMKATAAESDNQDDRSSDRSLLD